MAGRYVPAIALLAALALFVAAVPSKTPAEQAQRFDILTGEGLNAAGEEVDASTGAEAEGVNPGDSRSTGRGVDAQGRPIGGGGNPAVTGTAAACGRTKVVPDMGCRPPAIKGDGSTSAHRGVDGDTIRVVAYHVKANEQVQAILAAGGAANNSQREVAFTSITKWLNDNVELHGRKIEPIHYVGTSAANDPAGQQADAIYVAETLKAFAVITLYPNPIFHEELHRRGVLNFTFNQLSSSFYDKMSPHSFGIFPDSDLLLDHLTEYLCKRVLTSSAVSPNAVHAGDPTYQASPRRLGVIYQDAYDTGPALQAKLKKQCGKQAVKMLSYPADIGNAVAISTNIVTQMQQEGVTSVTCICDTLAPIFFTGQATKQGWFPEWIHNGYFVTDANGAGRLYEPTQWGNSFGVSTLSFPGPISGENGYRVCRAGGGDHQSCLKGQAGAWVFMYVLTAALERLGPNVSDVSVARQLVTLPALGGTAANDPRYTYGNQGPSPYTFLDDTMEIWYDPNREGTDGKRGSAYYVESGRRRILGQWPTTAPNVFVDDGSEQPKRDPDL